MPGVTRWKEQSSSKQRMMHFGPRRQRVGRQNLKVKIGLLGFGRGNALVTREREKLW